MELTSLPFLSSIFAWITAAALCIARIAPVFYMMPFLNSNILTGIKRTCAIVWVGMGIWRNIDPAILALDKTSYIMLAFRETMIGTLLGFLLAWPFWVFLALGSFIDNQRGATLSSSIDPANGIETSELANFFALFAAVVYLEGGGLLFMLEMLDQSYTLCEPLKGCEPNWYAVTTLIGMVVSKTAILASPVIAILLLSEALLGVLSRFAAQLNAFSVSLTVKSMIAFIVILMYFIPVFPKALFDIARSTVLTDWLRAP